MFYDTFYALHNLIHVRCVSHAVPQLRSNCMTSAWCEPDGGRTSVWCRLGDIRRRVKGCHCSSVLRHCRTIVRFLGSNCILCPYLFTVRATRLACLHRCVASCTGIVCEHREREVGATMHRVCSWVHQPLFWVQWLLLHAKMSDQEIP